MTIQALQYIQTVGNIPIDIPEDCSISIERCPAPEIYSFGFQPAKSIPEIPRWFLEKYATRQWKVLDPFAGSGTTMMETTLFGALPFWADYHPLAQLLCRVKSTEFDFEAVQAAYSSVLTRASQREKAPCSVSFANKDFWFQNEVCDALELLKDGIANYDSACKDFLSLVFACTVRKVSNSNDAMILAARRPNISETPIRNRNDVYQWFSKYAEQGFVAIKQWQELCGSTQIRAVQLIEDARELSGKCEYDAIVTSPPYVNAIDYVWASKFELHWLGYLKNDKERLNLYAREIGTERIPTKECDRIGELGHPLLDGLIRDIYSGDKYQATPHQNHLRARVVWKYFVDMQKHLGVAYQILKPKGLYCFAVGDTCRICGVQVPVASLLSDFSQQLGFVKRFQFQLLLKNRKLNIPRHSVWADTIKHDTIVVLEKR
jgi:hypothetical protein